MRKTILPIFFILFVIAMSLILNVEIASLNTTAWNFTGSDFLSSLVPHFPLMFLLIGCGAVIFVTVEKRL